MESGLWHSQVVRDTKLAEHKAAAANDFNQGLDHDLQQHASMAHKIVSGKYASQAVVHPAIALEHVDSQAKGWQAMFGRVIVFGALPCR